MKLELDRKYYLRFSDFDKFSNIKPSSVLDIFQDIASAHAELLGIGFNALDSKNLLWVVARTKFETVKNPEKYSEINIRTWPLSPKGLVCRREYLMTDKDGSVLIKGSSDWLVIDKSTRKPVRPDGIYPKNSEFKTDCMTEERLRRIKPAESFDRTFEMTPAFSYADVNGHVNNIKYADMAFDALNPENSRLKAFQIDYHNEIKPYEKLILSVFEENGRAVISGETEESEKAYTCEVIF